MISRMAASIAGEVVFAKAGATGQLEIVIKAVFDCRPYGIACAGPKPRDRLSQHVRGGVAQDRPARFRGPSDHAHRRTVGQYRPEVALGPV